MKKLKNCIKKIRPFVVASSIVMGSLSAINTVNAEELDKYTKQLVDTFGYTNVEYLNSGLNGSVYRAKNKLGNNVIIKIPSIYKPTSHREYKNAKIIKCTFAGNTRINVPLETYKTNFPNGPAYIIELPSMECDALQYLKNKIDNNVPIDLKDFRKLMKSILIALDNFHSRNFTHDDIKLVNFLKGTKDGKKGEKIFFELCDFGNLEKFDSSSAAESSKQNDIYKLGVAFLRMYFAWKEKNVFIADVNGCLFKDDFSKYVGENDVLEKLREHSQNASKDEKVLLDLIQKLVNKQVTAKVALKHLFFA